jgi:hypothetical protein
MKAALPQFYNSLIEEMEDWMWKRVEFYLNLLNEGGYTIGTVPTPGPTPPQTEGGAGGPEVPS